MIIYNIIMLIQIIILYLSFMKKINKLLILN